MVIDVMIDRFLVYIIFFIGCYLGVISFGQIFCFGGVINFVIFFGVIFFFGDVGVFWGIGIDEESRSQQVEEKNLGKMINLY